MSRGDLYQIMCTEKIHAGFPNVEAIFRLFLSLMATDYSEDRNLSQGSEGSKMNYDPHSLKRSALSILCIENNKLRL